MPRPVTDTSTKAAKRRRRYATDPIYRGKYKSRQGRGRIFNLEMMCRFPEDEGSQLRSRAATEGISMAELVRRYVTWGLETDMPSKT
jgi:hypothetical protein